MARDVTPGVKVCPGAAGRSRVQAAHSVVRGLPPTMKITFSPARVNALKWLRNYLL
jgi:hypothetical protein